MDLKGLLSLNFLLFLSLAFELSCGTGESLMNCQEVTKQLGRNLLLPLASEGISKSMNKSIHILVTKSESPQKNVKRKIVSLSLPERASLRFLENGYKFHPENLKLEILQSKKENEGWYFTTLEENFSVRHFCLQLKLFEQVSTPEIKVLNWTQENGNCSLTLACEVERGDHVAYSWREETGADPPVSANSSHLHLSLGPQHVHNVYVCTVSNPISNHSQTFTPGSMCMPDPPELRPWGLYVGLSSGAVIGVILVLKVAVLLLRRRGKANHYQPTTEAKSLTIYAQVQKSGSIQKKPDAPSAQDPCTTIYVAATEPVPEPVQPVKPVPEPTDFCFALRNQSPSRSTPA
ncbi:signaling lymphocytic activation molecule isoform X2 [Panthera tigris]|uniref:signaling lymphocytic activation molecule isoform X2 n=1 Tax=Panthera tigris TaxID=9694 RepID=UPI00076624CF|nr:signaling lymphocytic activation molecule isoform X2 [Panthera tigris]